MSETDAIVVANGEVTRFSIGGVFKQGWEAFKANWKTLALIGLVYFGIYVAQNFISAYVRGLIPSLLVSLFFMILNLLVSVGLIQITIKLARGEEVNIGMMFDRMDKVWRYFVITLVLGFIIGIGLILFIIPGIYLMLRFLFAPYLIVDQEVGIGESLKLSSKMSEKVKLKLMLGGLVAMLLNFLGMLAFGLGWIVTMPVTYLALAYVYNALLDRVYQPQATEAEVVTA